jgi:tetratricopeptide (TPR) repeat protein
MTRFTDLRAEPYVIPATELGEENPLPIFRNPVQDVELGFREEVPAEERRGLGWQIGYRVLPYRLQDSFDRRLKQREFESIVLENDFLKATFLPELGGRVIALYDKTKRRELLSPNPVIRLVNFAMRGAWFIGGIEWNGGHYGHHYLTCSPIFAARIIGTQGEPALRLYELERCKMFAWQIDCHLPPDSPFLYAHVRMVNTSKRQIPAFWWTTMGIPDTPETRVICPADSGIYLDMHMEELGFGYSELPIVEAIGGKDITYPINSPNTNVLFFRIPDEQRKWIAAVDDEGRGVVETSTARMFGRKMFCWGNHIGGHHWQNFLSIPKTTGYMEIQAGIARVQEQCIPMQPGEQWAWTQAFGYLEADPKRVRGDNWQTAWQTVDEALAARLSVQAMEDMEREFSTVSNSRIVSILTRGGGWGALENMRQQTENQSNTIPVSLCFPESTIGPEQQRWLDLLQKGALSEQNPSAIPGAWMVQQEWQDLLEASVLQKKGAHWYARLHLGVMYMENGQAEKAKQAWEKSIDEQPSCWAYRNLASLMMIQGDIEDACSLILKAWDVAISQNLQIGALATECVEFLCLGKKYQQAREIYESLPVELREKEALVLLRAEIALEEQDFKTVEKALEWDYARLTEKGDLLTNLWFRMWEKKRSIEIGQPIDEPSRQWIRENHPPPPRIEFRSKRRGYLSRTTYKLFDR